MICISPITIKDPRKKGSFISVPCGKCGACKHNRRTEWSFRLKEELMATGNAIFLTMTYAKAPLTEAGIPTLNKSDTQRFMKRLRKANGKLWKKKIRYYMVGEYGTITQRPHYHAIVYNIHKDLLPMIDQIWQHGHTVAAPVNEATIHYVTKYHVNYDRSVDEKIGRAPEFATMSRNPGIGIGYVERAGSWNHDHGNVYVMNNGFAQRMPRYYKEKIFSEIEREALAEEQQRALETNYWKEYERLSKKGVLDPDAYMEESRYLDSLKVEKKGKERMTL